MNIEFSFVSSQAKWKVDPCVAYRAHVAWIKNMSLNKLSASLCCFNLWSRDCDRYVFMLSTHVVCVQ